LTLFVLLLLTETRIYGFRQNHKPASVLFLKFADTILCFHASADSCSKKGWPMNPLITEDERRELLAHGQIRAAGQAIDPLPVVRLFTPDAHATWLLVALDPADGDTAYGLIDLESACPVGPRSCPIRLHRRPEQAAGHAGSVFARCARCRNICGWPRRNGSISMNCSRPGRAGALNYSVGIRPDRSESALCFKPVHRG
jgi:hypothetical protein